MGYVGVWYGICWGWDMLRFLNTLFKHVDICFIVLVLQVDETSLHSIGIKKNLRNLIIGKHHVQSV